MSKTDTESLLASTLQHMHFLRSLVDGLPFALFCKDYLKGQGQIVLWNRQAATLWGLEESDVLGKTDYDLFPKEQADFFRQKDLETLANGVTVFIKEEEVSSLKGAKTCVRTWKITLNEDSKPRYLIGISQNIADLKNLEDEIFVQGQKIAYADHLAKRTEIARQVAHDVNNPLAIVLGRANQIKRMLSNPSNTEDILQLVEASITLIKDSGQRVQYLTRLLENDEHTTSTTFTPPVNQETDDDIDFHHDLMNLLAIAQGKTALALRQTKDDPATHQDIEKKLLHIMGALKRIQSLSEEKRGKKK